MTAEQKCVHKKHENREQSNYASYYGGGWDVGPFHNLIPTKKGGIAPPQPELIWSAEQAQNHIAPGGFCLGSASKTANNFISEVISNKARKRARL